MRRLVLVLFSLAVALELGAITATKEYVDKQDAALRADLSGARNVQDLNVYGEVTDKTKPYLADDLFPIVCDFGGDEGEKTSQKADVSFIPDERGFYLVRTVGGHEMSLFDHDGVFQGGLFMKYNGRAPDNGSWPRLSFRTSIQPTADQLATTSTAAQVARSVVNTVWDSELGVAWEARMHNGQLYYVAVTNQPPEVK
jgi:hypothetical protein